MPVIRDALRLLRWLTLRLPFVVPSPGDEDAAPREVKRHVESELTDTDGFVSVQLVHGPVTFDDTRTGDSFRYPAILVQIDQQPPADSIRQTLNSLAKDYGMDVESARDVSRTSNDVTIHSRAYLIGERDRP